jgi:hypothetical protein
MRPCLLNKGASFFAKWNWRPRSRVFATSPEPMSKANSKSKLKKSPKQINPSFSSFFGGGVAFFGCFAATRVQKYHKGFSVRGGRGGRKSTALFFLALVIFWPQTHTHPPRGASIFLCGGWGAQSLSHWGRPLAPCPCPCRLPLARRGPRTGTARGTEKNERRTPTYICRAHPKSTHPPPSSSPPPPDLFFLIAFSGVSQQVEFKNTIEAF